MYFEDKPYEPYTVHKICGAAPTFQRQNAENTQMNPRMCNGYRKSPVKEDCSRHRSSQSFDYCEDKTHVSRKGSIFNPRSTLRFIADFKDWVSCIVLGTNRRQPKQKLVFKDHKSVTSVFLSSTSQLVTGQRLSSFENYASVLKKQSESQTGHSKTRSRKKRPAPLPPPQRANSHETDHSGVRKQANCRTSSKTTAPKKRSSKKRRAPLPPTAPAVYATVIKREKRLSPKGGLEWKYPTSRQNHIDEESLCKRLGLVEFEKQNSKHYQLQRSRPFITNFESGYVESDSDETSHDAASFSDSADEKYGSLQYKMKGGNVKDLTLPGSSNFVHYASDTSDVCLKISIQKTETNVVTVEEMPSSSTVRYTIDEESSSSELSDDPPLPAKKGPCMLPQPSLNSTTDSSDEAIDKTKTIFEELKIQPPSRGSVKDFVNAFNMLASKGTGVVNWAQDGATSGNSPARNAPSVSTHWEFENKVPHLTNKYLLPIAEESLNENSEYEDVRLGTTKHRLKDREHNKVHDKKCSHCSENHSSTVNTDTPPKTSVSKSLKNNVAPCQSVPKNDRDSKASAAALSSLLQEAPSSNDTKGFSSNSLKCDSKWKQPIMVGLYIEDKSSHRGPMPLLVTPSMSLKKLKKQIEGEYGFPRHQQCWILGECFAVQEEASLASYGIHEAGCSVLLYVMGKTQSLPCRTKLHTAESSAEEEASTQYPKKIQRRTKGESPDQRMPKNREETPVVDYNKTPTRNTRSKKNSIHKKNKIEAESSDYRDLLALDAVDLVANTEVFECPVCFVVVEPGQGAVLQDCLHSFCRECLSSAIQYSDTAQIQCLFRNDEYSCDSHLQEREIKCLVDAATYERHLQRSMALAESQAADSFHCRTADCPGWCLYEDNVNVFRCPVCHRVNCLTCAAIHQGQNCKQYQDYLAFSSDTSEEAKKTKEYLEEMVVNGEAMKCPQCHVVLMKKWGCDWLKCSMCHIEVCWVTKGPRWGPAGRGDTTGGCQCMVNGVRCHPKCSYCH